MQVRESAKLTGGEGSSRGHPISSSDLGLTWTVEPNLSRTYEPGLAVPMRRNDSPDFGASRGATTRSFLGHSLLDSITPKGDRQCLKHIGLRGFQALFVIKMPRLHFGGSKRLSVSNRYSSYWTPKVISATLR